MTRESGLSWAEEERLYLLQEECAEVIQAVSKILRHGYYSHHPDRVATNKDDLERELGDLKVAVDLMIHEGDILARAIHINQEHAMVNKNKYLHHNEIPPEAKGIW